MKSQRSHEYCECLSQLTRARIASRRAWTTVCAARSSTVRVAAEVSSWTRSISSLWRYDLNSTLLQTDPEDDIYHHAGISNLADQYGMPDLCKYAVKELHYWLQRRAFQRTLTTKELVRAFTRSLYCCRLGSQIDASHCKSHRARICSLLRCSYTDPSYGLWRSSHLPQELPHCVAVKCARSTFSADFAGHLIERIAMAN